MPACCTQAGLFFCIKDPKTVFSAEASHATGKLFYTWTGELWFSFQPGAGSRPFNWGCYENNPLRAGIKDFNFIALFCTCSLPVRSMGVKFSVLRKFRVQFPEAL